MKNLILATALITTPVMAQTVTKPSQTEAVAYARNELTKTGCLSSAVKLKTPFNITKNGNAYSVAGGAFDITCSKWATQPTTPPVEVKSAVISWKAPTERVDGTALKASEIKNYTLYFSNGYTMTLAPTTLSVTVVKSVPLPAGTYKVYITVADTNGLVSSNSTSVTITI